MHFNYNYLATVIVNKTSNLYLSRVKLIRCTKCLIKILKNYIPQLTLALFTDLIYYISNTKIKTRFP